MWTRLLALSSLLCCASPAWSAEYFVANGGTDSGPCSKAEPCQSIATAATKMRAGDTVYLRGGTYSEEVTAATRLPSGLSDSQRTLVAGYPGETARFVGGGFNLYFPPEKEEELAYVTFDNFVMDGSLSYGLLGSKVHHIRFSNSERLNAPGGAGVGSGFGTHHNEFVSLHVHHNGPTRANDDSGNPNQPGGHGFYVCGQFMVIRGNNIHDNGNYGLQVYDSGNIGCSDDSVIEDNEIHDNHTGDGAATINYGSRSRISRNRVYNNRGDGLAVTYGHPDGVVFCGNTITNNTGSAISIGDGVTNTVLKGNVMSGNSQEIDDRGSGTRTEDGGGDCPAPASGSPTTASAPAKQARPAPKNLRVLSTPSTP